MERDSGDNMTKTKNKYKYSIKEDFVNSIVQPLYVQNIKHAVVKPSPIHGFGLFSIKPIKKGTLLCTLTGQILPKKIYEKFYDSGLPKEIFIEKSSVLEDKVLAIPFRTSYSFINHSPFVSHIEEKFCDTTNQIFVYAKVDIKEGEEILGTYNLNHHIDVLGGFNQNDKFSKEGLVC